MDRQDAGRPPLGRVGQFVAAGLIVAFLAFTAVMVWLRGDPSWDRLVYLFTGLEALVFAAAGALFGTVVQRAQTHQALQTAQRERTRADANEQDARHGDALAALIQTKAGLAGTAAGEEPPGARGARPPHAGWPAPAAAKTSADLAELAALADRWFPRTDG